jgi:hypothetical protein
MEEKKKSLSGTFFNSMFDVGMEGHASTHAGSMFDVHLWFFYFLDYWILTLRSRHFGRA